MQGARKLLEGGLNRRGGIVVDYLGENIFRDDLESVVRVQNRVIGAYPQSSDNTEIPMGSTCTLTSYDLQN